MESMDLKKKLDMYTFNTYNHIQLHIITIYSGNIYSVPAMCKALIWEWGYDYQKETPPLQS